MHSESRQETCNELDGERRYRGKWERTGHLYAVAASRSFPMPTSYEQHIVVLALGFLNAVHVHVHDAASLELAEILSEKGRFYLGILLDLELQHSVDLLPSLPRVDDGFRRDVLGERLAYFAPITGLC